MRNARNRLVIDRDFMRGITPSGAFQEYADATLIGFGVRVTPAGATQYTLRYRKPDGKFGRKKIGTYPAMAVSQAREAARKELELTDRKGDALSVLAERRKKRDDAHRIAGVPTLRAFLDGDYSDWLAVNRKTGTDLADLIRMAFADLLNKRLDDVTTWTLEKWKHDEAKKGNTAATAARKLTALQGLYRVAIVAGHVSENPVKAVTYDGSSEEIVRYLSPDERERLYAALVAREDGLRDARDRANDHRKARRKPLLPSLRGVAFVDHLRPAVLLSLNTGLRRGELLALEWTDIDLVHAVLTVRRATAKGDKTRRVPLNMEAFTALKAWKPLAHKTYVFAGATGEPITEIKSAWLEVLRAAKIDNYRWHDHRHDFASRLVQRGVDLNTVRELLGHADLKMVLRYAHLSPEHTAAAVALLDAPAVKPGRKLHAV